MTMSVHAPGWTSHDIWRRPRHAERRVRAGHAVWYEPGKRALDLAISLAALPVVLVVVAICVVAIKIESPGPALFRQERTGKGGRRFRMFKLRTMVPNAQELKARYMHLNEHRYPDFKITNDPRVTRCGRVLRKTSLDELPQLFNVILGDMTLVGPRPTSFGAETYRLWHTARLEVKPGLTGLWQVSGRADLDFDDRLRLDIAYIRNRSLRLDVQILVRTFTAVLSARGAN
ncbi:MAG TPA: sugar transferase [Vicinamibacterales bacterium]|nr:sugar transferase [Vicinamibacterales bacterium]